MSATLRALLQGAIDYAGLFPPAALSMADAVANYHQYRSGEQSWALGRFVAPATRLKEFAEEGGALWPRGEAASPWRVSALLPGADLETEVAQIADFDVRYGRSGGIVPDGERGGAWIDTVEVKADTPSAIARIGEVVPRWLETFVELPVGGDPEANLRAVADAGLMAKVRTGGVTPDAFPTAAQIARFMRCCVVCKVTFKATAGLHHALRADHPLTYDAGAATGPMFGYLNVFLAAAFARQGVGQDELVQLLEEREASALVFDADGAHWRGLDLPMDALLAARTDLVRSFGSCSFTEPMDEARAFGLS